MLSVFRAELLKLRKRPAIWVCFILLLVLLIALGYALTWFIYTYSKPPANAPRINYAALKVTLYPAHFHQNTLAGGAQLGGVLAMIIGVLVQGSEYGWGTVKTAFTQWQRRWAVIGARLAVLSLVTLAMALVTLGLAALTSSVFAGIDGKSSAFPDATTIVKTVLAFWLILELWALFGFALATLFQQSALAIGLGLAYALVIESLIFGLWDQFGGDTARSVHQWFPLDNMSMLVQWFGRAAPAAAGGEPAGKPFASATHAVVMLIVYCGAFVAASIGLTERRDVT